MTETDWQNDRDNTWALARLVSLWAYGFESDVRLWGVGRHTSEQEEIRRQQFWNVLISKDDPDEYFLRLAQILLNGDFVDLSRSLEWARTNAYFQEQLDLAQSRFEEVEELP